MKTPDKATPPDVGMPKRNPDHLPHPVIGWGLMVLGLVGLVYFPSELVNRMWVYGLSGLKESEMFAKTGWMTLFALLFLVVGFGVVRRWRWVNAPALILSGIVGLFILFFCFYCCCG